MTVLHPGIGFGGKWAEAKFPFGKAVVEVDPVVVESGNGEKARASGNEQTTTELRESA
jgi:hypothetical protein